MSELKMADVWGWDAIPQDYGHYESFTLNGVERKGDFYGLLFCTEEAANAVSHAVKNHDRLEQENAELREALQSIKNKVDNATSLNEMEAVIYMICDQKLNK